MKKITNLPWTAGVEQISSEAWFSESYFGNFISYHFRKISVDFYANVYGHQVNLFYHQYSISASLENFRKPIVFWRI